MSDQKTRDIFKPFNPDFPGEKIVWKPYPTDWDIQEEKPVLERSKRIPKKKKNPDPPRDPFWNKEIPM